MIWPNISTNFAIYGTQIQIFSCKYFFDLAFALHGGSRRQKSNFQALISLILSWPKYPNTGLVTIARSEIFLLRHDDKSCLENIICVRRPTKVASRIGFSAGNSWKMAFFGWFLVIFAHFGQILAQFCDFWPEIFFCVHRPAKVQFLGAEISNPERFQARSTSWRRDFSNFCPNFAKYLELIAHFRAPN